jgi:thioredoxin reductase (NADPH)
MRVIMKKKILKIISSVFLFFCSVSFANSNNLKSHEITKEDTYSVVILGGGVGGLSSGLYLARAGYSPLIIEGQIPGGLITQSHMVENWPGEEKISGIRLAKKLKNQAEKNGCIIVAKEVIDVDFSKKPFVITIRDVFDKDNIEKIYAKSCIIAMGTSSNFLGIKGEEDYWGRGVSNCAVCDGALYKDKNVAIIGGGDAAILEASYLCKLANRVSIIVRKNYLRASDKAKINALGKKSNVKVFYNTKVVSINGSKESIKSITVYDNMKKKHYDMDIDGVFLAIGSKPNTEIFKGKLNLDSSGYIIVNSDKQTSIEGVYAVGDIIDPEYKQAITASAAGAVAATACQKKLDENQLIVKNKSSRSRIRPRIRQASTERFSSDVIEITDLKQFEDEINTNDMPVLVDFYASWCAPCKRIAPLLESKAKSLKDKVKILKVNVQKNKEIASKYQITAMPTVIAFDKDGKMLFKKMGMNNISTLLSSLDKIKNESVDDIEAYLKKAK